MEPKLASRDERNGKVDDRPPRAPRRRWPWVVLAVVVLLFGGPIAWQYRPLSEGERQIMGVWQVDDTDTEMVLLTFTRGRRLVSRSLQRPPLQQLPPSSQLRAFGRWTYVDGTLTVEGDLDVPWSWQSLADHIRRIFLQGEIHESYTIEFDEGDRLRLKRQGSSPQETVLERLR